MTDVDRARRATSFGAFAEEYDRFRPGPPDEAVGWLLDGLAAPEGRPLQVIDIGAGTGALSRRLISRGTEVISIEPDRRMGAVLATKVPPATVACARAEQLPLRDTTADAVVGASMWHWVDQAAAAAEAARVLRPGGVLGVLWGGPDRSVGWLAELFRARSGAGDSGPTTRHEVHLPDSAPFHPPEAHVVTWSLTMTPDELVGLAGTYSGTLVLDDDARARRQRTIADLVRDHPDLRGRAEIELPMRCVCWRARRLG
jgi:SAM-dependent methyltransferase